MSAPAGSPSIRTLILNDATEHHFQIQAFFGETPAEPDNSLPTVQRRIADVVVRALVASKSMSGWGGTTSEAFIQEQIKAKLNQMDTFARTGERIHINYVWNDTSQMSCYSPQVSLADIKLYANFQGYQFQHTSTDDTTGKRYSKITGTITREEAAAIVKAETQASASTSAASAAPASSAAGAGDQKSNS